MSLLHRAVHEKDDYDIVRCHWTRVRPATQRNKGGKGSGWDNEATRKRKTDTSESPTLEHHRRVDQSEINFNSRLVDRCLKQSERREWARRYPKDFQRIPKGFFITVTFGCSFGNRKDSVEYFILHKMKIQKLKQN